MRAMSHSPAYVHPEQKAVHSKAITVNTTSHNGTPGQGGTPALKPRQKLLLAELIGNPDVKAACSAAGVSRTAAYKWLADPNFSNALRRERDRLLDDALSSLRSKVSLAVEELGNLLKSKDDNVRRMACNDVLRSVLKSREHEELEARIASLEKILEDRGQQ